MNQAPHLVEVTLYVYSTAVSWNLISDDNILVEESLAEFAIFWPLYQNTP
jgi:hypothetical protein